MEEYQYNVSDFKGPLDLLLYLIEKNKVDIYNIPIVEITDQFNAYVNQINAFDVNYASKFFVMAATLLQIKSRHLLPKPPKPESEDEETPEEILVRQLVEYKHMKKISQIMGSLWEKRSCMINRPRTPMHYESRFIGEIDKESLYQAFCVVYQSIEEKKMPEICLQHEVYSVDECMQRVTYVLRRASKPTAVLDVFRPCHSRIELVVTFLAVLELLKRGRCRTVSDGEDGNTVALRYTQQR